MELNHCQSCGHPYYAGEASYCRKCGEHLETRASLIEDIKKIESETKTYGALRFTMGVVAVIGWLVIIFGWLFAFTAGAILSGTIARIFVSDGSPSSVLRNMTFLISTIAGMLNTIFGISLIASTQIIEVLLDIGNDIHITRRFVRRFGLDTSKNTGTTTSAK